MEEYTFLRQFADSWMLLMLFIFFVGVIYWAFRPGSKKIHQDSANIPFRHTDAPLRDDDKSETSKEVQK